MASQPDFRIKFDLTPLLRENLGGIGVYTRELFLALSNRAPDAVVGAWRLERFKSRKWLSVHLGKNHLFEPQIKGVSNFFSSGRQVFHGPDARLLELHKGIRIITVHDLGIYETGFMSSNFSISMKAKFEKTLSLFKPHAVLCVSDFVKGEMLKRFPEYTGRVFTTHLGCDHLKAHLSANPIPDPNNKCERMLAGKTYLLFLGALEIRKNVLGIIEAFERVAEEFPDLHLVLAGADGFGAERIEASLQNSPMRHRILRFGFVSDVEREFLYKNASIFVFPSFYEGFGIPVLESMQHGCVVITSQEGSLQEITDRAAAKVNPNEVVDLVREIKLLLTTPHYKQTLIENGFKQVKRFTWEACAQKTMEIYQACFEKYAGKKNL